MFVETLFCHNQVGMVVFEHQNQTYQVVPSRQIHIIHIGLADMFTLHIERNQLRISYRHFATTFNCSTLGIKIPPDYAFETIW